MNVPHKPLGQLLVEQQLVDQADVEQALEDQAREGGLLGRHLLLAGAVKRRDMYRALADQWGTSLVDLVEDPPQPDLLAGLDHEWALSSGWLPYRQAAGHTVIATSVTPTSELLQEARTMLGTPVQVVATTDWDIQQALQASFRREMLYDAADKLSVEDPAQSAKVALTPWQMIVPLILAAVCVAGLIINLRLTLIVVLCVANISFATSILFKTLASVNAPIQRARRALAAQSLQRWRERLGVQIPARGRIPDEDLPVYTILIPAFHEANIIGKLIENIGSLDYPMSKLEVLLLLEEDDQETIAAAKAAAPPANVRILVVPRGVPQTKPRACNYGLAMSNGEFVVIFDAEDRPEPDQLRKAIDAFREDERMRNQVDPNARPLICVQAALNYFNAEHNVLTRMFAVEYSHWFDSMLPGLEGTGIPLPLGGTSNHFRARELRELGGWDPWNVTEDADLGLRASVRGYRVGIINSTTWEEACSKVPAWIRQRTRWIKGYMVTAAVNMRHPWRFVKRTGLGGAVGMIGLIAGTPLAFLSYPLVLAFTLVTYVGVQFIGLDLPGWLLTVGWVTMIFGNAMMIVVSAVVSWKRYGLRVAAFALLNPAYWVLHSIAAWRAAYQMVRTPHVWEKTPHGLDEDEEFLAG
ncbi:glycosyltransferase [Glutamicibacter sp. NPDC087344]|uniref:glycosyltransferase n=1 Tax=Glutamicibacter sp. NPDC087344 TaxID=3363994 RepID=UPI0037F8584A